eukprot:4079858-Alexandrium_andersonii.AAC.1
MSASLVGSEMCIRDSSCVSACPMCPMTAPHQTPRQLTLLASVRSGPGTVSYTHLTLPTICSV